MAFQPVPFWLFPRGFRLKAFFLLGKAKRILLKGKRKMTKENGEEDKDEEGDKDEQKAGDHSSNELIKLNQRLGIVR